MYIYRFRIVDYNCLFPISGTLMGTGDVIAQFAVERKSLAQYEFSRTSRFLLFGTVVAVSI